MIGNGKAYVSGSERFVEATREQGLGDGRPEDALVFDASALEPSTWDELEARLVEVFELTKRAVAARAQVVYVLHEPSLFGHGEPLRAMLATGLLGGARSLAVEGRRDEISAHAVTIDGPEQVDTAAGAVLWLLGGGAPSGQVLQCGAVHLGKPAA